MAFHPNMQSEIEGVSVIGDLRWRAWNGVLADVWTVACAPDARGEYVSQAPRLVVILDKAGKGGIDIVPSSGGNAGMLPVSDRGNLHYVPAHVPVRAYVKGVRELTHLDIHLDTATLVERFSCNIDPDILNTPRLGFSDERLQGLARLIAGECAGPTSCCDLYGDSLVAALAATLLQIEPGTNRRRGQLPPCKLLRVKEFIEENCMRTVRLEELAALTGLSPSYFCAAFKTSTGVPPHKWQMRARIDRAKSLLRKRGMTLAEVAVAVGFSDQAHLTRVFRKIVGTTPAAWLRDTAA